MNSVIRDEKLVFVDGEISLYLDAFINCEIALKGGKPKFFMCTFLDCTFVPPIPMDGNGYGVWAECLVSCMIDWTRAGTPQ